MLFLWECNVSTGVKGFIDNIFDPSPHASTLEREYHAPSSGVPAPQQHGAGAKAEGGGAPVPAHCTRLLAGTTVREGLPPYGYRAV